MSRMIMYDSENREVTDIEIHVPKQSAVDAFIQGAVYADDGTKVSEEELNWLTVEYASEIQAYAYQNGSLNHN